MINIVIASNNKKKIAELETLFGEKTSNNIKILSLKDIGFYDDIAENGTTFEENSLIKASTPVKYGYIGVADDSGLSVDYLGGAPGIFSARYSGADADDEKNRKKLLESLDGVPEDRRSAKFICTASIVIPESFPYRIPEKWRISDELAEKIGISAACAMVVRGECHGVILTEEHGNDGFGYDSLFFYPDFGATFAEIPQEKKNSVSHRGIAMREFIDRIVEIIKNN